jgi:hypothetical protein
MTLFSASEILIVIHSENLEVVSLALAYMVMVIEVFLDMATLLVCMVKEVLPACSAVATEKVLMVWRALERLLACVVKGLHLGWWPKGTLVYMAMATKLVYEDLLMILV